MLNRTRMKAIIAAIIAVNVGLVLFLAYRMAGQREAFLSLRSEDAFLFLEGISHNLETASVMQQKLKEQLAYQLDVAAEAIIPILDDLPQNGTRLQAVMDRYRLWKIVRLDANGQVRWSSRGGFGRDSDPDIMAVCKGQKDRYVIGLKENYRKTGYRFGLARSIPGGGALVLIVDADELHNILSRTTFSHILSHVRNYEGLEFVRFENMASVIYDSEAATGHSLPIPPAGNDPDILEAIFSNQPFTRDLVINGRKILEAVWPIYVDNIFQGVIRVGLSLDYVRLLDNTTRWLTLMTLAIIAMLDVLLILAWRQSRRINREARKYQMVLEQIQDGVLVRESSGDWTGNDSIRKLLGPDPCEQLRDTPPGISRIQHDHRVLMVLRNSVEGADIFIVRDVTLEDAAEESRLREERLFSTGKLASSFAHEIRNPLNTISMIFQQVQQSVGIPEPERDLLVIAEEEVQRLNGFIEDFMRVAKDPDVHPKPEDAGRLIEDAAALYRSRMAAAGVTLTIENHGSHICKVDRDRMKGVLINLLENAMDAGASHISLRVSEESAYVRLDVEDDGAGMTPEQQEHAFDLYYTTKQKGTGLGLAYVQRIVSAHGGLIRVSSEPGGGTRFSLFLPKGETP